jgi:hypothetical protein
MASNEQVIEETKKWIEDVVVGCNFCPFAGKELKQNSIRYLVETGSDLKTCLQVFMKECIYLDTNPATETTLIIFPSAFQQFDDYLDLVELAESLLVKEGYEGIYQVASFHPQYMFAGAPPNDAANFSNRSIYPMLHILREESIEKALKKYPNPELIPERNILFAREKGVLYMKMLREACMK